MKQYIIKKSTRKNKKYMAVFKNGDIIHFGDNRYQQFQDKTPLQLYKTLDHNDDRRKKLYYLRHGKDAEIYSAKWFSHKYLW